MSLCLPVTEVSPGAGGRGSLSCQCPPPHWARYCPGRTLVGQLKVITTGLCNRTESLMFQNRYRNSQAEVGKGRVSLLFKQNSQYFSKL